MWDGIPATFTKILTCKITAMCTKVSLNAKFCYFCSMLTTRGNTVSMWPITVHARAGQRARTRTHAHARAHTHTHTHTHTHKTEETGVWLQQSGPQQARLQHWERSWDNSHWNQHILPFSGHGQCQFPSSSASYFISILCSQPLLSAFVFISSTIPFIPTLLTSIYQLVVTQSHYVLSCL
jgi:hypothetical protein